MAWGGFYDRVQETSTTTGVGTYTLAGASQGYQAFSVFTSGTTVYYCATDNIQWEVGSGIYTTSGATLTRVVVASSSGGSAINWATGTRMIFATAPASVLQYIGNLTANAGYLELRNNRQSANYTLVLSDSEKCIVHPSSDANARLFTIDSHANVGWPDGTCVSFQNWTTQVLSIAVTTDTLVLAGTGTTGTRSLAQYGIATAHWDLTESKWLISGVGLT